MTVLGQSPGAAARAGPGGRRSSSGTPRVAGDWQERIAGHESVVNLAGASIFTRWTEATKKLIRSSRILTTRNVVDALPASGGVTLVSTSAVGYYGFHEDEELGEDAGPGDDFLARLCVDWEAEALRARERGARVAIARFGIVLGPGGGVLGQMAPLFRAFSAGRSARGGSGSRGSTSRTSSGRWCTWRGGRESSGPYNLTAPEPVTNRELTPRAGPGAAPPGLPAGAGFRRAAGARGVRRHAPQGASASCRGACSPRGSASPTRASRPRSTALAPTLVDATPQMGLYQRCFLDKELRSVYTSHSRWIERARSETMIAYKSKMAKKETQERVWYVIDATDKVLGRLATRVARIIMGKNKPEWTPHVDCGDHVVVINASKVKVTGRKLEQKVYHRHTGYPGGLKTITLGKQLAEKPERVIEHAVQGMCPKGILGRHMVTKLKVYGGPDHPHTAQKPQAV